MMDTDNGAGGSGNGSGGGSGGGNGLNWIIPAIVGVVLMILLFG